MRTHSSGTGDQVRPPIIVWLIIDGKAGHANQSRGLVQALAERVAVESHVLDIQTQWLPRAARAGLWPKERDLPRPDLIVGAGHRTHYWLLGARFWRGGRTVVLMRPTLPAAWFDLCIVSEHDQPASSKNSLAVRGVLSAVRPSANHDPAQGLFLIGGPCRHARWDDRRIAEQVIRITTCQPSARWRLTTSRRTPDSFLQSLAGRSPANLDIFPHSQTDRDWVLSHLANAAQVWVSPDSVSMLSEALTSGAAVGLLDLEWTNRSKLVSGLKRLSDEGWVTPFGSASPGCILPSPPQRLDEAGRCADWIIERWLSLPQRSPQPSVPSP